MTRLISHPFSAFAHFHAPPPGAGVKSWLEWARPAIVALACLSLVVALALAVAASLPRRPYPPPAAALPPSLAERAPRVVALPPPPPAEKVLLRVKASPLIIHATVPPASRARRSDR
jgi:hypothetical protein